MNSTMLLPESKGAAKVSFEAPSKAVFSELIPEIAGCLAEMALGATNVAPNAWVLFGAWRRQWNDGRTSMRCITAAMLRVMGACWG
jgi:hypothetical protein